jgi:uncharacterized protein (TIGR03663 family)
LRFLAVFLVPILLAAALRFPALAARPMHADEAIHADKLGTLLEGGGYVYDPRGYHGPTLYDLTLISAWLQGARRYVDTDEVTLRAVPAALGVGLVAAHIGARGFLGGPGAAIAALLAALSPAMVFYSRYFIHEVPLVFFSFGALLAACRYLREADTPAALQAGAWAGLMYATKETAPLALVAMLLAFAAVVVVERRRGRDRPTLRIALVGRHVLLALLAATVAAVPLFSSFGSNPRGLADSLRAYAILADRARGAAGHVHGWDYYLRLLVHFPAPGAPVWTEGLILALAALGGAAAWSGASVPGADARALRFLSLYTLLMVVSYSAIPYKTPWCLLGFLHGMILLAGVGAVVVVRACRGPAVRALVGALLVGAAGHLGWQAFAGSFRFASDPRNPYVYAQTGNDVFEVVARLKGLAQAHPDGMSLPVQVISRTNLWPLPFYLRGFPNVAWWTGVSDEAPRAPVVLLTPDMEPALVRKLYDLPPPGERELYVSIFERPVELRPEVEVRGYAARGLWEDFRRREAESVASAGAGGAR